MVFAAVSGPSKPNIDRLVREGTRFSMSSGNIPYAFRQCDELIVISRKEERSGSRVGSRNVPVVHFRDTPDGRKWIEERESLAS